MSTDVSVVCDLCRTERHLGQRMGTDKFSFGYGTPSAGSLEAAVKEQAETMGFIVEHLQHNALRILLSDDVPDEYVRVGGED